MTYELYYNALYPEITQQQMDDDSDLSVGIYPDVLNTLPSYVASQLKMQDDPQLGTIMRNEFELLCQRLQINDYYEPGHFESEGG